jgi:hypothetical protein
MRCLHASNGCKVYAHNCPLLLCLLHGLRACSKYDKTNKGGLAWEDIQQMILGNMNIVDPVGW